MDKLSCEIEIINRFKINRYGFPLVMISGLAFLAIIFSTALDYEYSVETFSIITLVCFVLIVIGMWIGNLRKYEKAQLNFHPEGIIMSTNSGFIPLKYDNIKKLSMSNIIFKKNKTHFYVYSEDNRKFEIQSDADVYDALVEYFPEE